MGLNRVSNPRKLRRLSTMVGQRVIRAYARWFQDQRTLLAFTDATTAFVVNMRTGEVELYTDKNPLMLHENGISQRMVTIA